MATYKPTVGPHQIADEGTINVRAPMPFVCPFSYLVLILAYLYRPLYHLLPRHLSRLVVIESLRCRVVASRIVVIVVPLHSVS